LVIGFAAGGGDPVKIALIVGGYLVLGVMGWGSNYEELRDDVVYVSRAAEAARRAIRFQWPRMNATGSSRSC
jgi:hypothetical protein